MYVSSLSLLPTLAIIDKGLDEFRKGRNGFIVGIPIVDQKVAVSTFLCIGFQPTVIVQLK